MTNIEHMREQIVKTVIELDEMGLLQLAEDTEMNLKENEGIFNCIICENEFGECNEAPCTKEYCSRFLNGAPSNMLTKKEYMKKNNRKGVGEWF